MLKSLALRIPPIRRLYEHRNVLLARVAELEKRVLDPRSFPIPNWWERNYWEPTVALAIRDHCRPGDVVFDVGANAGALSMMMSRLVGPRGIVCAFEASPRIIDKTHFNLVNAGCTNVTVYHKAVWHTTGDVVNLAAGSDLNDRIDAGATGMSVRTVALDDFAAVGDLRPSFIKMDIEGAEFDALKGMTKLLRDARPVLVLEQSPEDMRCHALLIAAGYVAADLATYRRIRSKDDFPAGTGIANVLFVHEESAQRNPYFPISEHQRPNEVATLSAGLFKRGPNGDISIGEPLFLPPGRLYRPRRFCRGRHGQRDLRRCGNRWRSDFPLPHLYSPHGRILQALGHSSRSRRTDQPISAIPSRQRSDIALERRDRVSVPRIRPARACRDRVSYTNKSECAPLASYSRSKPERI
jgi:FkbM family methyltransferase